MFGRAFATAAAAAVLQFAPIAPALAGPPPIEAYGRLPALDQVAISADGQKIAYLAQVGDRRALLVRTLSGETVGALDVGNAKIRKISWFESNYVLIERSQTTSKFGRFGSKSEYSMVQIYNVTTKNTANMFSRARNLRMRGSMFIGDFEVQNRVYKYYSRKMDGKSTLLAIPLGSSIAIFKIDPDTGEGIAAFKDDFGLMDDNGRMTVAAHSSGRDWWLAARDGVGWREVWRVEGVESDWPSLLGFGRTFDSVLVSLYEGGETRNLYEVSLKDGKRAKLDIEISGTYGPVYHESGRLLGFTGLSGNHYDRLYVDPDLAKIWSSIEAGFPNKTVTLVDATPDFSRIIIQTWGQDDSGTYFLVDRANNQASRIGTAYPAVPADAVNEQRWIKYQAADGLEIPAYLTLPRGRAPKDLPLIVLPHGGPAARDTPGFDWWSQALASRGYVVLQPQFRGSTGFGRSFLDAGDGQWGRKMQTDLSDGVRHLAKEGVIDPKRVCIFGWSYGGYAAMAGPTLDPGVYRCAIAGAGISDVARIVFQENGESLHTDSVYSKNLLRDWGIERINDPALDAVSPVRFADRVDIPFMLIHGKDDLVVDIKQSEDMAAALKRAGKPFEFVVLDGEDHWLSSGKTRLEMLKASIAFIEKHNPPN